MSNEIQRAQDALQFIDPHDRDTWLKAAMALKSEFGEAAREIWEHWSSQADNYSSNDADTVWQSCKSGAISIATLFYLAKKSGWQPNSSVRFKSSRITTQRIAIEIERKQSKAQQLLRQQQAARRAKQIWRKSYPADANHTYLQSKQIKPLNLRVLNNSLVIPIYFQNRIVNIQFIKSDGAKRFLKDGQVKDANALVGQLSDVIYITEGFATGATIHQVTSCGVLCAMNAGNLMSVAQQARANYPAAHIVIAADNDHQAKTNTGKLAAYQAARAIRAEVLLPEFPEGSNGSDWNDLYLIELDGVKS